ncbi:hypothetical protein [Mycolicibacterium goodii]|uniref:hypothetical protein n=1 Tax=Mycolicibacterium goodii TaxID=134601 RepID=UPI001BDC350E|nr:hypothetical protein [Mycolicibacterium goodii]MBU8828905.1 hypothetical protein [Mycolicibacterium goodii]
MAPLVAFLAQWHDGVGLAAASTLAVVIGPFTIFLASFANRSGYWRLTRFDLGCGLTSCLALILWLATKDANLALVLAIAADLIGGVPTIVKAWYHPHTERGFVYLISASNGGITLLTLQHWNFSHFGFPIFLTCFGVAMTAMVKIRASQISRDRQRAPATFRPRVPDDF